MPDGEELLQFRSAGLGRVRLPLGDDVSQLLKCRVVTRRLTNLVLRQGRRLLLCDDCDDLFPISFINRVRGWQRQARQGVSDWDLAAGSVDDVVGVW